MMMNDRILVSGANGFVGRALCVEAKRRGMAVRGAVRTHSNLPSGVENLTIGAIDDETDWTAALRDVDVVIHLAARVHIMRESVSDPLAEFLKVNLEGTAHLARQAARAGVRRFVYVSSIKVNGEETQGRHPFTELDEPAPQDPYAISKWEAEKALWQVAKETSLEVIIVRSPLVYGPGVGGNFIGLFAAADKGIPLPLGGADNARSLIYVGNLVDALITCAMHSSAAGQTYLVSDGKPISTANLADKIFQVLGRRSRSFVFPLVLLRIAAALLGRSNQIDRLFGSLQINDRKIRRELNWTPPYSLEFGLRATAEWYRSNMSSADVVKNNR